MATRQEFIDAGHRFYGVRWLHEGRSRRGVDCAGVVIVSGWETDLLDRSFDVQGYARQTDTFDFAHYFDAHMTRKRYVHRRPGDVLLFRNELNPCHCAILFDRPGRGESLIHADARRRRVTYDPLAGPFDNLAFSFCYEFDFED